MPTPNIGLILDEILQALQSGKLPSDSELTEGTIAKILGINRTSVRQILRIITKVQHSFPEIIYNPPRGTQRSSILFGGTTKIYKSGDLANNSLSVQALAAIPNQLITSQGEFVICPQCKIQVPASEVRHTLHETGSITCSKCRIDITDYFQRNDVD